MSSTKNPVGGSRCPLRAFKRYELVLVGPLGHRATTFQHQDWRPVQVIQSLGSRDEAKRLKSPATATRFPSCPNPGQSSSARYVQGLNISCGDESKAP